MMLLKYLSSLYGAVLQSVGQYNQFQQKSLKDFHDGNILKIVITVIIIIIVIILHYYYCNHFTQNIVL